MSITSGTYFSAASSVLPARLPSGGNVAWTAAAWVKCAAPTNALGLEGVLEWGAVGDASGVATTSALALTVGGQAPPANSGVVSTLAGGTSGHADGTGTNAKFLGAQGVAVIPSSGSVVVSEYGGNTIRLVTPAGVATTLAGHPGACGGSNGNAFAQDGVGTNAYFCSPRSVAVIPTSEVIVVADNLNNRIRLVTTQGAAPGTVTSLAGGGYDVGVLSGYADSTGTSAVFNNPYGLALLPSGISSWPDSGFVIVADTNNHRIRIVTYPGGVVSTLAGGGSSTGTSAGFVDATGTSALFNYPSEVAPLPLAAGATSCTIAVADAYNHRIRLVTYPGGVVTTLAGSGAVYPADTVYSDGIGVNARFGRPFGLAVLLGSSAASGSIAVVDEYYQATIRIVTYPDGNVRTLAGLLDNAAYVDGTGTNARFGSPQKVAVNPLTGALIATEYDGGIRTISVPPVLRACDEAWHHVALTYAPSASPYPLSAFLDGALSFQLPTTVTLPARADSTLRIGWSGDTSTNGGSLFAGSVYDLRIYPRNLSAAEVAVLAL